MPGRCTNWQFLSCGGSSVWCLRRFTILILLWCRAKVFSPTWVPTRARVRGTYCRIPASYHQLHTRSYTTHSWETLFYPVNQPIQDLIIARKRLWTVFYTFASGTWKTRGLACPTTSPVGTLTRDETYPYALVSRSKEGRFRA